MKQIILILLNLTLGIGVCFSQNNAKLFNKISTLYIGLEPDIYENISDTIIRIHVKEYSIIDNCLITKNGFESFREDSISENSPISNYLNENDLYISPDMFEEITIKEVVSDSNEVVFEKLVDFIGDKSLDRLEFKNSDYEQNGVKPLTIRFYENVNNEFIALKNLEMYLWEKPLKYYISKVKYLGMSTILILIQSDIPEKSKKMEIIMADRIEKK